MRFMGLRLNKETELTKVERERKQLKKTDTNSGMIKDDFIKFELHSKYTE